MAAAGRRSAPTRRSTPAASRARPTPARARPAPDADRPCVDGPHGPSSTRLGFDPALAGDDGQATVAFTHCPFRELAEANPDLVCGLHRGLVEGFVDALGGAEVDELPLARRPRPRARSTWLDLA